MFEGFDVKLCIYVIICIILLTWGTMKVKEAFELLGALIYFGGVLYICIIYGIRWFGTPTPTTVNWPPIINTCPDYLTYYDRKNGTTTQPTCIDTLGISKMKQFPADGSPPSDPDYYFSLVTTTNDKNNELCKRAMPLGLTWEGITNGESCFSQSGTVVIGGGSSTCPPAK